MDQPPVPYEQVAERVERLLLRHAEIHRINEVLVEQVASLTRERELLQARLHTARIRIDAVLARLPPDADDSRPGSAA